MDERFDQDDQNTVESRPSRTRRKKEAEALQKIGERLMGLPPDLLRKLELPEELRQAVSASRRMTQNGARRRQRQLIGALMREIDPEPIRAFLSDLDDGSKKAARHFQYLEHWRDSLVAGDDAILNEIFELHPETDRQHLIQLVRNARQEKAQDKPPRAFRALFKYLREISGS